MKSYRTTVRFLVSRGVQGDTAEETAQAAWVRAWERLPQLRNPDFMLSWVNSIAFNLYRQEARSKPKHAPLDRDLKSATGVDTTSLDVARLMEYCSHGERQLLRRYYFEEVEIAELAAEAGVTPITIRVQLMRARKTMAAGRKPRSSTQSLNGAAGMSNRLRRSRLKRSTSDQV